MAKKKEPPVPLIVFFDNQVITGKTHARRRESMYSYEWYDIPDSFEGVVIHAEQGDVDFFCGCCAVGEFSASFYGRYQREGLTSTQRKSVYSRFLTALRRRLRSTRNGELRTQSILTGDVCYRARKDHLSLWEMGHMLPSVKATSEYTNINSGNRVKMFMFNG